MRWKPLLVALIMSAFACIAHAADTPRTVRLSLVAEIEVDADGRVTFLEWRNAREPLHIVAERIEPHVRGWRFKPGAIDGVPQVTRTHLTVAVAGDMGEDGSVAFSIEEARTGARSVALAPPRYPVGALMAGVDADAVVDVRIDADGTVAVQAIELNVARAAFRKEFLKSLRAAIAGSTFQPERVGGRTVAAVIRLPYEFCSTEDCMRHIEAQRAPSTPDRPARPRGPVALDSAVRLLD